MINVFNCIFEEKKPCSSLALAFRILKSKIPYENSLGGICPIKDVLKIHIS